MTDEEGARNRAGGQKVMFIALAGIVGFLALLVIVGAPYVERALMYQPSGGRVSPEFIGLNGVKEVVMRAPDGNQIIAWYAKPGSQKQDHFVFPRQRCVVGGTRGAD